MRVLITGADGFLGKNLQLHLMDRKDVDVICFTRSQNPSQLPELLKDIDFIFHFAGINRPQNPQDFVKGNQNLTQLLCDAVSATGRNIPIVFTSSTQADRNNPYGLSKLGAEDALFHLHRESGVSIYVFRLPNVFGKWCKPNYNSAVATFCHNIARGIPIRIDDPAAAVTLVYIDDVVRRFIEIMDGADRMADSLGFERIAPQYTATVGQIAEQIKAFKGSRETLMTERVGTGLTRALHATYLSYLPTEEFSYQLPQHRDQRGVFVEMLKTADSGQFSFFTAHPGVTRGGHYHHSKTEKFLVLKGQARFRFRHLLNACTHEIVTSEKIPEVVETIPGWTHDITNIGNDEMIVMLWANEVFDRSKPDTFSCPL